MTKLVTETIGGELYQYYPLGEHVVRAVGYVRAKVMDSNGRVAWTQPVFVKSGR